MTTIEYDMTIIRITARVYTLFALGAAKMQR